MEFDALKTRSPDIYRTRTGKYKVCGKTYRNKKLAIKVHNKLLQQELIKIKFREVKLQKLAYKANKIYFSNNVLSYLKELYFNE